jgi:hypothetical protein
LTTVPGSPAASRPRRNWRSFCSRTVSRGPFGDVRRVLVSLADLATENSVARGRLLWVAAIISSSQNDFDACAELSEESLRIGTAARDVELVSWALITSHMPLSVPRIWPPRGNTSNRRSRWPG